MNSKLNQTIVARLLRGGFALTRHNTKFTFLRHAHAVAADGGHDSDRRISSKGQKQCAAMKSVFETRSFNVTYRSPLIRVWDTLVALNIQSPEDTTIKELVIEYGQETRQSGVLDAAYEIMGSVGLADIMKHKEVATAMDEFAAHALAKLNLQIQDVSADRGQKFNVLVAGHGWLNPILAYYMAGTNETARRHLLYHPMGECEIIEVGITEDGSPIWNHIPCPAV